MANQKQAARAAAQQAAEQAKKARKKRNVIIGAVAALAAVVAIVCLCLGGAAPAPAGDMTPTNWVEIDVKDYGTITAELYGGMAPVTVENFVKLAGEGFYDGLTFHRIISGFMIQGGDPAGNGTGGSGKNIKGEFSSNGVNNPIAHERGVLSMARSAMPDSASSQFFIMHKDAPHLNGQYAAFGRVLSGMEVVDAICENTPVTDSNGTVASADQPVINAIRVIEKPAE